MDALLLALQNVSEQLLPILGAVALIFVCILLNKLSHFVEQLTNTVKSLDSTIKLVDQSMNKVQVPLDTAVKYSHSLDKVHDKTTEAFGKLADFASENADSIKTMMDSKLSEATTETVVQPEKKTVEEKQHE